ncbi:MAG: site-2 protease family protein, partial [Thermoplasmata archaeon]|nr:site-2 protease family protein [Thermoplasmata archaeon]
MISAEAEIESIRSVIAKHFTIYGVLVTPLALTFQVANPPTGVDAPFDALRQELVPRDYIPTLTEEKGELLVHVQRRPKARFRGREVNVVLLILTVLTTVFFGGAWNWADYSGKPLLSAESIGYGALFFSVPLLTILGSHEMGHYLVAKRYNVRASLPFFLPSLPPLGTFGAFISMRDPIPNRRALLDIGVSGPLVGFAIAIPVTLAGLLLSSASPSAHALTESPQPSLLLIFLSQFFPIPGPVVQHPLAFAGWVGLFVTAINLLPAGQLDGGHVARALLGRRQFYVSWASVLVLFGMGIFYPGWYIFGFLIFMLGVRHPPPLNDLTRLDPARKLVGIA